MAQRKIFSVIVAALFLFLFSPFACAEPDIEAKAGILIDMKTAEVLWSKNPDQKMAPASTTKILTALLALDEGNLSDTVEVSSSVKNIEGTKIWLRPGEKVILEDLLYAMLLNSANDAAVAIAEHIGGSLENFAKMMNAKAKEIGAENSNFLNPNGLDQEGHYTTARDLALIARKAMENEKFRTIVQTKQQEWNGMDLQTQLVNTNNLLWQYEGTTGIKTGYTTNAGNCLVSSAKKGEQEFLSVVLGDSSKSNSYNDSIKLLDYGFENFKLVTVVEKGQQVSEIDISGKTVPVVAGESYELLLDKNQFLSLNWEMKINKNNAPIEKDGEIGILSLSADGEELAAIPLLSSVKVSSRTTWLDWYFRITVLFLIIKILSVVMKNLNKRKKKRFMYGSAKRRTSLDYRSMRKM